MKVTAFPPCGIFGEICYIVSENESAVLIDAPGGNDKITNYLDENNLKLKKILLTHGHIDHIMGLAEIAKITNAEVFISLEDKKLLSDDYLNLSSVFGLPPAEKYEGKVNTVSDGDEIPFEGKNFKVMLTPGHTEGSVIYIIDNVIFSGDTIFKGSIGRTDMPGGNTSKILKSLRKIALLDGKDYDDYDIYSGHSEKTTLKHELSTNPYLKGNQDYDNMF